jgi:flagellar biosynthesis/type III secretory pathway M-ring protein FliF/YscJ
MKDTDGNGIANMDEKYAKEEGRKVVEDSKNILDLVKNPNKFFFIIIGLVVAVIAIFVGIIFIIRKVVIRIKRR